MNNDRTKLPFMQKADADLIFRSVIAFFIIVLIIIAVNFVGQIRELEKVSQSIDYITDANAQMQRLVRMEISEEPSDELINTIDAIFENLSKSDHSVISGENAHAFRTTLVTWTNLKTEIYHSRASGWKATRITYASETAYYATSRLSRELMTYFTSLPALLSSLQFFILAIIMIILVGISIRVFYYIATIRTQEAQVEEGYIDKPTGLYNRSKCQELLDNEQLSSTLAVFGIYDLNNLKHINDTQGHQCGDEMIAGFAAALKKARDNSFLRPFVGRYGGDEFIIYIEGATSEDIKKFSQDVDDYVAELNKNEDRFQIAFARGRAYAHELQELGPVGGLFDLADSRMYQNKIEMKRNAALTKPTESFGITMTDMSRRSQDGV